MSWNGKPHTRVSAALNHSLPCIQEDLLKKKRQKSHLRVTGTKCCSVALIIRAGKSPAQHRTWEQGQGPNTSPATLNNNCWSHSGFVTEKGLPSTLWKRENLMGILSLKSHLLVWAGFSRFTDFKCPTVVLATAPHALPSGFWGPGSWDRALCFSMALPHLPTSVCLGYSPWAKSPDRFMFISLYISQTISLKWTFHTMLFINSISLLSYNCSSCLSWTSVRARKL